MDPSLMLPPKKKQRKERMALARVTETKEGLRQSRNSFSVEMDEENIRLKQDLLVMSQKLAAANQHINYLENEVGRRPSLEPTRNDTGTNASQKATLAPGQRQRPRLLPTIFSLDQPNLDNRPRLDRCSSIQTKMVIDRLPKLDVIANGAVKRVLSNFDSKKEESATTLIGSSEEQSSYFRSSQFAQDVVHLAKEAAKKFRCEERLMELSSPVHIFGDIHGNEADLRYFSQKIWPLGICLTPGKFLFLGDYVDRGSSGLEVVACLFAYKISMPDKVFLLRGNHETRGVNGWEAYFGSASLLAQCKQRFGVQGGSHVWEEVNRAFDVLPLAAIIDSSIFCVHGGIPRCRSPPPSSPPATSSMPGHADTAMATQPDNCYIDTRLDEIRRLPIELGVRPPSEHETYAENRLAVDLMWSDPAKAKQEQGLNADGFGEGERGADAICYGAKAVDDFLRRFGLSYVIRAHEPTYTGITISKSARVLTVFSTSKDHGCGEGASCGCILVDNDNIFAINRSR